MASKHFCVASNITKKGDEESAWQNRFKRLPKLTKLPFGCLLDFKPSPVGEQSKTVAQFALKAQPGIFLGYPLHPGGRWRGEYFVKALDYERPRGHRIGSFWTRHSFKAEFHCFLANSRKFLIAHNHS